MTKPQDQSETPQGIAGVVFAVLGMVFAIAVIRTAWVCDDAYFTMRTVDNFVHGFGPTWNIDERVQAFTHPLWMFILSIAYFATREAFYTNIFLSASISCVVFWLAVRAAPSRNLASFAVLSVLVFSKAFMDYSTSGLENPVTHLLLAAFMLLFLRQDEHDNRKQVALMGLIAGLAALNRMDSLLFYLPALLYLIVRGRSWRNAGVLGLGFLPFVAWEIFSIIYYGFPFPNPAYAKLGTGIGQGELFAQGIQYFLHTLRIDPLTLAVIAAGLVLTVLDGEWRERALVIGVTAYLCYVLWIGGDFMSGRFFSAALLVAVFLLLRQFQNSSNWDGVALMALVAALLLFSPTKPLDVFPHGVDLHMASGIEDERAFYFYSSSLVYSTREGPEPHHEWARKGMAIREAGTRVSVGATGFLGYFAGPYAHIVDDFGLGDPLLARLPFRASAGWKIGHFSRHIPPGYVETLESGENSIRSQSMAAYYGLIRQVTRDRIWSLERFKAIWWLNSGQAQKLISGYRP
jgi:arabinofuranosyltransferase